MGSAEIILPRVVDGKCDTPFPEIVALANGMSEITYRADMEVLPTFKLPRAFCEKHPDVHSVAITCDPILSNVLVASKYDNVDGLPPTHAAYDEDNDVLAIYYNRTAFCAENVGGGIICSSVDVFGWVKVTWEDGQPFILRESDYNAQKACSYADSCVSGVAGNPFGSLVSEKHVAASLKALIVSSAVASIDFGDGIVKTLLRKDAFASNDEVLQTRYAYKHIIVDYGGFEKADSIEPGIVDLVFSDKRMWTWSFTYAPESVWAWNLSELLDSHNQTKIYEV